MLSEEMLFDLNHPSYAWYVSVSSMQRIYGTLFDNTGQPIFLKLVSEIKVTVVAKLYMHSLRDPKMCPQTKLVIPMSS